MARSVFTVPDGKCEPNALNTVVPEENLDCSRMAWPRRLSIGVRLRVLTHLWFGVEGSMFLIRAATPFNGSPGPDVVEKSSDFAIEEPGNQS
jgi:hypothetical protein